jgi:hypothetical protein
MEEARNALKMFGERISEMFREEVSATAILKCVFGELYMCVEQLKKKPGINLPVTAPYCNTKLLQLKH